MSSILKCALLLILSIFFASSAKLNLAIKKTELQQSCSEYKDKDACEDKDCEWRWNRRNRSYYCAESCHDC